MVVIDPPSAAVTSRTNFKDVRGASSLLRQTQKTNRVCVVSLSEFGGLRVDIREVICETLARDGAMQPLIYGTEKTNPDREILSPI